jgi:DNA-binding CsgD family transcriptional regulator
MGPEPLGHAAAGARSLIGRERELASISRLLDESRSGQGRILLISGEAGIGKSRLLAEVELMAGRREVPVLWGRAAEAEGAPPYWPWLQVLRRLDVAVPQGPEPAQSDWLSVVSRLSPTRPGTAAPESVAAQVSALGSADERFIVFESIAQVLSATAEARGLVILLDDLHWADPASLRLLSHVAREWRGVRGLLVAAHRNTTARDEPLRISIGELARVEGVARMELNGFDATQTASYLESLSGRPLDPETVATLQQRTNGNPFFVTEFGRLIDAETPRDPSAFDTARGIPQSVRDVIAQRLSRLQPDCQQVLEVSAVIGAEPSPAMVAAVMTRPLEDVLQRLDEAAGGGLLTRSAGGAGYAFTHSLVRDALYSEISPARRVHLHERVAVQLEQNPGERASRLAELAHHWLLAAPAGHAEHAGQVAEQAGEAAMQQLAYEEAARLYAAAAVSPVDEGRRARLLLAAARAQVLAGELERAAGLCREAAVLGRRLGNVRIIADAALVIHGIGDTPTSTMITELCEEALAALPPDALQLRSRLLAQLTTAQLYLGSPGDLDRLSTEALVGAEQSGDVATIAAALHARQVASTHPSGVKRRLEVAARMLEIVSANPRPVDEMWARLWRFDAFVQLGDLAAAELEVDHLAGIAERMRQPLARWHVANCRYAAAHARGEFAVARRMADDAATLVGAAGQFAVVRSRMQRLFLGLLTGEDCSRVVAAAEDAWGTAEGERLVTWMIMPRLILALFALSQGRTNDAAALYDALPPASAWRLIPSVYLVAGTHRARLVVALGRRDEASRLYRDLLPFAEHFSTSGAGTVACFGSIELYLGMLAGTLGRLDTAVQHLQRAVVRNDAAGMRPYTAESRFELALALHRRGNAGDAGRALALTTECTEAAQQMGMQPLLHRATELHETLRSATRRARLLTPREMEIARFLAEGLTSREIAEAMHISARTADNHAQHILDKLGLRSRSQIAAWVARQAPP